MQCVECMCVEERDLSREGEQSSREGTRGENGSCRLIEREKERAETSSTTASICRLLDLT